jgi:hypothetical protein
MSDETRAYCGLHEYECKKNKEQLLLFVNKTGGAVHRRLLAIIEKEFSPELKRINKKE